MSLCQLKKPSSCIYATLVFLCLMVSTSVYSQKAATQNKQSLENKKKKLNEEINEINSLLSETKASKKTSLNQLVAINKKISIREELISTIVAEIQQLNKEIKQNEREITKLQENLKRLKDEYARMIYFAQRNRDSYSRLVFIFASGDFNQAYLRLKYFQQYSQFRKKQANEIVTAQKILNEKIEELKSKKHEKDLLLGNEEEEKGNLTKEREGQEVVLTELQKRERQLKEELQKKKRDAENLQLAIKRLIEAEIKRKAELAAKEAAAAAAAKKAAEKKAAKAKNMKEEKVETKEVKEVKKDATMPELSDEAVELSNDFANNRGKLPWPVTKGYICEQYGEHEHPAIKGFMMFNNGVEICSSIGAQARAVFAGEVTGIAVSPTGGKLVIIRHGEYLSVYSNLGDVSVKTGDKVAVKQPLGTILHNEDEGKSSINLQIWKGQKTMDPSGWLSGIK